MLMFGEVIFIVIALFLNVKNYMCIITLKLLLKKLLIFLFTSLFISFTDHISQKNKNKI